MKCYNIIILICTIILSSCISSEEQELINHFKSTGVELSRKDVKRIVAINKEQILKKEAMSNKVINLSFLDFKIGEPISECLKLAKSNPLVSNITHIDSDWGQSIQFNSNINGVAVECNINSIDGDIAIITIMSTDFDSTKKIIPLYKEKYGEPVDILTWNFNGSSIKINIANIYKERLQVIPGRENVKVENIYNKYEVVTDAYFEKLTIVYSDNILSEKIRTIKVNAKRAIDSIENAKINKQKEQDIYKLEQGKAKAMDVI